MAKKQNAIGLSTLLLGFSVGTLGEQSLVDLDKVLKYEQPLKQELDENVEGGKFELGGDSMDESIWDNGGGFLNLDPIEDEDVVYVSDDEPEEDENESYTDMVTSLLTPISID